MLMIAQVKPFVYFLRLLFFLFFQTPALAGLFCWCSLSLVQCLAMCVCETLQWHSFYCIGRMVFYIVVTGEPFYIVDRVVTGEPFGGFCEQIRHMYANSR